MRFTRALTDGYALCLVRPTVPPLFETTLENQYLDMKHPCIHGRTLLFQSTTKVEPHDSGINDGNHEEQNRDHGYESSQTMSHNVE